MLVDFSLFFKGTNALVFAGILSIVAIATKWLAAQATGFIYKYTKYERRVMFGLSASHAAATLAAQVPLPPSPPPSVVGADERTFGTQTVQPVIEIAPPARRGNYRAGFYNILPNIVPPAELAAQARDIGMAQGFRQGRRRGEAIGALEGALQAVEALRFQQTTKARGTELFTVPELQQRFAEGGIIRAAGGRARAIEAAAEEAAPK